MANRKAIKPKTCKACGDEFTPFLSTAIACSPKCALDHAESKRKAKALREFNKETKRRKLAIKTRSQWMKEVQIEFNKFIRWRDHLLPCISCDSVESGSSIQGGKFDCGHFLSVGAHPELRFNEMNAHKQCKKCNNQRSGNVTNYRIRLIDKIGLPLVDWLEGPHKPLKSTIDELKWLKAYYKQAAKEAETYMNLPGVAR